MDRGYQHDLLEREIIVRVNESKLARVWKQPTGAAYRDGRLIHYGIKGAADITGLTASGRRLEIEVKTGEAVQRKEQKSYQAMIGKMGGLYLIARDVDKTLAILRGAEFRDSAGTRNQQDSTMETSKHVSQGIEATAVKNENI
jgi:hypothetical protein